MITTICWDFGNVLIEWDPRNLYRQHLDDDATEEFLGTVWTESMNLRLDRGESLADLVDELAGRFPDQRHLIELYDTAWTDMLGPIIPGSEELVDELRQRGIRQLGLSNWSLETFARARDRVASFQMLDGWVLSGEVGVCKPDPAIYRAVIERFDVDPASSVFIDDRDDNCVGARNAGFHAIQFTDTAALRRELAALDPSFEELLA